ncbi:MAG: phosphopantetheine-binding protein [Azonexus sp.]|jgi:acyl carrier protein
MESLIVIREFLDSRLGIGPEKVLPEVLLTDLGVDSLMLVELMFEFEDRFNIALDNNLAGPSTVGELAALMDRLRGEQG